MIKKAPCNIELFYEKVDKLKLLQQVKQQLIGKL